MNRLTFILSIISVLTFGCAKSDPNPYQNDLSLIGTWISRDGTMIMNIKDLDNKGDELERYYEYTENGQRFIRRTYQNISTNYQVVFFDGYELRIATRGGQQIAFLKAS